MSTRRTPRPHRPALAALAAAALLAGCSGGDGGAGGAGDPAPSADRGSAVSAERCALNEAAGTITYVTGYQFQSSVSILDPVAAEDLGYFDALCLDVEIQPGTGETAQNAQLVAAGTAQVSSIAGASDVLVNVANGVDVTAVALFGHVPVATLMTGPEVSDLTQLEGATLGHKGALPVTIEAMLRSAGVDVAAVEQVQVGYDPTVLARGQVQALTGYKSNEPLTLREMGEDVTEWNPEDHGVPGSIAATIVNPGFLDEHPTAVQDFLRAQLRAYAHCEEDAAECVALAAERSQVGYDTEHNQRVWETETRLVADSRPAGQPLGTIDPATVRAEADFLLEMGQVDAVPDVDALVDEDVVASLYEDGQLVWPAP
ncbi:ABC transporter substrate-binding protein [Paenibacillus sp. TRM 82003]|uniref:ABC transporter substrate-binding protein n=1 Tax=Kineococcus sp. TRM81007 TaxID=2925831 RepID=UPI001F5A37E6|nr:ABC transporter substrate-binding protein [Kineococcus sp. TRM81007]MCI2240689.1 ABC transporter substrate-binding protein [Kineococcus sp. TRM81007]MCI3925389.1 ABC transporter substrate-binding protein [Paenibacillus sp. TRM 82003]